VPFVIRLAPRHFNLLIFDFSLGGVEGEYMLMRRARGARRFIYAPRKISGHIVVGLSVRQYVRSTYVRPEFVPGPLLCYLKSDFTTI
jgi:hypothetical protein